MSYNCNLCNKNFDNFAQLLEHFNENTDCKKKTPVFECCECQQGVPGVENLAIHMDICSGEVIHVESEDEQEVILIESEEETIPETCANMSDSLLKRRNIFTEFRNAKRRKTNENDILCKVCKLYLQRNKYKMHLRTNVHKDKSTTFLKENIAEITLRNPMIVKQYRIYSNLPHEIIIKNFLLDLKIYIKELLIERMMAFDFIKINMVLFGLYVKNSSEKKHYLPLNISQLHSIVLEILMKLMR